MGKIRANLHEAQRRVIFGRKRFNSIRCGRRWGKSHSSFALAGEKMTEIDGAKVLYTAPTFEDLKKRYAEAVEFFRPFGATWKEGEIRLGRSVLEFHGIYRFDAIRGNKYHRFLGDEWAHSPYAEDAWNLAIRPTLSDFQGDAYFFSTPKGDNHFKKLCERQGDNWQTFHFPTSTNPYIKPEEIESARIELPSLVFAQEYLAEFVDSGGARVRREWLKYATLPNDCSFSVGVDFAISTKETADYTAIVVVGRDEAKNFYIADAVRLRGSLQEIMSEVRRVAQKWNAKRVYAEQVQAQAWAVQELLRTTDLNVKGVIPTRDKLTRFQIVEARFEQGLIFLNRGLHDDFERELLGFTGTNADRNDDFIDALVYAMQASMTAKSGNLKAW